MFKLRVFSQKGDIDEEVVIEGDSAIIGRASDCNVVIDRKDISRRHARVLRGWVVDDLGSRNGTYVDGGKLEEATLVPRLSFEVGDPTSENLVTIEVLLVEPAAQPERDASDPQVTGPGSKAEPAPHSRTTLPLTSDSDPAVPAVAKSEFEAETERYRYKCAKLELELEQLRRKLDASQKGSAKKSSDGEGDLEKTAEIRRGKPRDERPKRDGGAR